MAHKALPQINFQYENRQCGGCTACCHAIGIEELGKPYFIDCKNQTATGCSLHLKPDKPPSCSRYKCAWLLGEFELEDRPDKSGVIFHAVLEESDGSMWMEGLLTRPDIDKLKVQSMIEHIVAQAGRVRLIRFDQVMNCGFPLDAVTYPGLPNVGEGCEYMSQNQTIWFLKAPKRVPLPVVS